MPLDTQSCLDISSPRLFTLWLAQNRRDIHAHILNPDYSDITATRRIIDALRLDRLSTAHAGFEQLETRDDQFDFVYSISVVEHVAGSAGDTAAMGALWRATRPGGTLAVTFPVDRSYWEEYRQSDVYGLGAPQSSAGMFFFQRYYDAASIEERLCSPLDGAKIEMSYFGERTQGFWEAYERSWLDNGIRTTVEDPRLMVDEFRPFREWEAMPGKGVCLLRAIKTERLSR
ncbi:MAG: class I SAM-dependent methyltransferase [Thermoleophilia bacterium]